MQATTQLTDIINEQNKYVQVTQGGKDPWNQNRDHYLNYRFLTTHFCDDLDLAKIYYEVAKEFIEKVSENRLILLSAQWDMKNWERWENQTTCIPPVYVEDGLMQQFKEELMQSDRKDIIWEDYMWYQEKRVKGVIFFWRFNNIRNYHRDINILLRKMDFSLMDRFSECSMEGFGGFGIVIFSQFKISDFHHENNFMKDLVHSKDFILKMGIGGKIADILVENNPRYISYEEIVEIIEPIFNKYGLVFTSKENPYIKDFGCEGKCHQCERMCKYNLNPEYHT